MQVERERTCRGDDMQGTERGLAWLAMLFILSTNLMTTAGDDLSPNGLFLVPCYLSRIAVNTAE